MKYVSPASERFTAVSHRKVKSETVNGNRQRDICRKQLTCRSEVQCSTSSLEGEAQVKTTTNSAAPPINNSFLALPLHQGLTIHKSSSFLYPSTGVSQQLAFRACPDFQRVIDTDRTGSAICGCAQFPAPPSIHQPQTYITIRVGPHLQS